MPDNSEQLDRDLDDMSGNPAIAKHLKESLRRLSDGSAGPELAEMAREVLEGRTDLRTVARSSAYADQMTEAVGRFQNWQAEATPEERSQLLEETQKKLRHED
jgi:hypothetical protein